MSCFGGLPAAYAEVLFLLNHVTSFKLDQNVIVFLRNLNANQVINHTFPLDRNERSKNQQIDADRSLSVGWISCRNHFGSIDLHGNRKGYVRWKESVSDSA